MFRHLQGHHHGRMYEGIQVIIIIIIIIIITTTTTTAIEFSTGGSSFYTNTNKTNKNKYIETKQ